MDFRSDRAVTGNRLLINYLPAVNRQQTYRLATLYPYATQPLGEMGGSAEIYYNFKPKTNKKLNSVKNHGFSVEYIKASLI
jgi:hypothetical protein